MISCRSNAARRDRLTRITLLADAALHAARAQAETPITLDEVTERFLPLPGETRRQWHARTLALALAQELWIILPDRAPQKTAVVDHLVAVADLSCEALGTG